MRIFLIVLLITVLLQPAWSARIRRRRGAGKSHPNIVNELNLTQEQRSDWIKSRESNKSLLGYVFLLGIGVAVLAIMCRPEEKSVPVVSKSCFNTRRSDADTDFIIKHGMNPQMVGARRREAYKNL